MGNAKYWNRLHRFQKTIIILIIFIFVVFIWTHFYDHPVNAPVNYEHRHEIVVENVKEPIVQQEVKQAVVEVAGIKFNGASTEWQRKVVDAMKHAWKGYKEYAWGQDELKPISKSHASWFNLGLTIVDSLDTIIMMNLKDEYQEARDWIKDKLNFDSDRYNNLFELTIRVTGGLLSAYHLTGDSIFLTKAIDSADRTLTAFETQSHIPLPDINLARRQAKSAFWNTDNSIAGVATLQLEYKDLTYITHDPIYASYVKRISAKIHELNKQDGLVPIFISTNHGRFIGSTITLGARGDSYYEYLLKQWIQMGNKGMAETNDEAYLIDDWLESIEGVQKHLLRFSSPNKLAFIGESISGQFSPKMDHLVCFLPGNLALGSLFLSKTTKYAHHSPWLLSMAENLTETCVKMYDTETGLSPEIVYFNINNDNNVKDIIIKDADKHNLLRPETIESLYYLYKITKNKKYQKYGERIFDAFEKYTKVETGGYTSINDVTNVKNVGHRDKMESFFLAETLKYFYLLFESDESNEIDLNKWVFNTEAHLVPIWQ